MTNVEITAVARIIARTATDLGRGCIEPCDTDGGTCICVELHWEQAKAAINVLDNMRKDDI
jgi:hypothetical protein